MYFFVLFYGAAKVQNLKGKKIQPISPPASKPIFWLCLEQPDTGVASPKVWPWLYLLSHSGRELTPCQFWAETWAIHQVFQTTSWKWRMFGSCLFDHGEMLPWLTWENPKYDISKLGADIFGVCSDVSNYSLPKNWFLFGNNVQNTKICCLCLVCKALEQTDFHLFFMFLN